MSHYRFDFKQFKTADTTNQDDIAQLSIEKAGFERSLRYITSTAVRVENINSVVDSALTKMVELVEKVVDSFEKTNTATKQEFWEQKLEKLRGLSAEKPKTKPENEGQTGFEINSKHKEDWAFEYFGLSEINTVLEGLQDLAQILEVTIPELIGSKTIALNQIITPPDSKQIEFGDRNGNWENPELLDRLKMLLLLLQTQLGINLDDLPEFQKGIVSSGMMRNESYYNILIPELNKLVFVCNEEGNVTYVFDTRQVEQIYGTQGLREGLNDFSKEDKNQLIKAYPASGFKLKQQKNRARIMVQLLNTDDFTELNSGNGANINNASPELSLENLLEPEMASRQKLNWIKKFILENGYWPITSQNGKPTPIRNIVAKIRQSINQFINGEKLQTIPF